MGAKRFRVLLDLSLTSEGYSGIPHVTRLLYRLFSRMPEVDLTGLIYCPYGSTAGHQFAHSAPPASRLVNQAKYLQALTSRVRPTSDWTVVRWLQDLAWHCRTLTAPAARCQEMLNEAFWDVIWRNYLSQALGPADLDLVRHGRFVLSTFSTTAMNRRLTFKLPAQGLDTRDYDFVIFQDSRVARVSPGTRKIVCYHDLIPLLRPDCLANRRTIALHHAYIRAAAPDSLFVCNTNHTRADLTGAYPTIRDRSLVIPYPLGTNCYPVYCPSQVANILRTRQSSVCAKHPRSVFNKTFAPYVLAVATLEPRKNYASLIRAFHQLNSKHHNVLRLVIVANPGWQIEPIVSLMKPLIEQGQLIHLTNVNVDEMRVLYSHARALAFLSYYEGFGLSTVEAMQCHTPVVLSDIPPHRDVAGDAAHYCDPYDVESIRKALWEVLFSRKAESLRESLIRRGQQQIRQYEPERIAEQWLDLFERIRAGEKLIPAPDERERDQSERLALAA